MNEYAEVLDEAFCRFTSAGVPMEKAWEEARSYADAAVGSPQPAARPRSAKAKVVNLFPAKPQVETEAPAPGHPEAQGEPPAVDQPDPDHPASKTLDRFENPEPVQAGPAAKSEPEQLSLF